MSKEFRVTWWIPKVFRRTLWLPTESTQTPKSALRSSAFGRSKRPVSNRISSESVRSQIKRSIATLGEKEEA